MIGIPKSVRVGTSIAPDGSSEQVVHDFLMTTEGLELAGLFPRLRRGRLRRKFLDLVRAIVEEDLPDDGED